MEWILNKKDTQDMKNCEHGYRGGKNSYHLEGSVLTHTKMVFEEIQKLTDEDLLLAAAQLHDLGKPLARHEKNERTYFSGHEGISAYLSLNYAKKYNFDAKELFKLVALHGILYRYPKRAMIEKAFDKDFWDKLSTLIKADHLGRITDQDKTHLLSLLDEEYDFTPKKVEENIHFKRKYENIEKKNLVILIGPPNSGKSTYINKFLKNYKRVSRDNLVLEYGKRFGYTNYDDSFNNLKKEQHIKINEDLDRIYRKYTLGKENIVIDMTNMSPKSRRKWSHMVKKGGYSIKYVLFLTSFDKIMKRNKNRKNKNIPQNHIIKFMNKFTYPIPYKEKYDELEIIVDEDLI